MAKRWVGSTARYERSKPTMAGGRSRRSSLPTRVHKKRCIRPSILLVGGAIEPPFPLDKDPRLTGLGANGCQQHRDFGVCLGVGAGNLDSKAGRDAWAECSPAP